MGSIMVIDSLAVAVIGSFSVWHWLIVLAVVLILVGGGGKIPRLRKGLGSGINQFKKGMKEEEGGSTAEARALEDDSELAGGSAARTSTSHDEKKKAVNS